MTVALEEDLQEILRLALDDPSDVRYVSRGTFNNLEYVAHILVASRREKKFSIMCRRSLADSLVENVPQGVEIISDPVNTAHAPNWEQHDCDNGCEGFIATVGVRLQAD